MGNVDTAASDFNVIHSIDYNNDFINIKLIKPQTVSNTPDQIEHTITLKDSPVPILTQTFRIIDAEKLNPKEASLFLKSIHSILLEYVASFCQKKPSGTWRNKPSNLASADKKTVDNALVSSDNIVSLATNLEQVNERDMLLDLLLTATRHDKLYEFCNNYLRADFRTHSKGR